LFLFLLILWKAPGSVKDHALRAGQLTLYLSIKVKFINNNKQLQQDNIIIPGVARMRIFIYPVSRDR
jgi:hypothetical protein